MKTKKPRKLKEEGKASLEEKTEPTNEDHILMYCLLD
jgi:hypothetical protein